MQIYFPINLKLNEILPKELENFKDDIKYFIHKIYEQSVLNKKSKTDFVFLKTEYLRKIISQRKFYLIKNFLINNDIVETDYQYIIGEKSYGYRLGKKYKDSNFKKINLEDKILIKKIIKEKKERENNIKLDVHQYLYEQLKKIEIKDIFLKNEKNEIKISIDMIKNKNWFFHCDEYGRVHTNITNLKSKYRKKLFLKNTNLKEIDIINSQPFFFAIILIDYLINEKSVNLNNKIYIPPPPFSLRCYIWPNFLKNYINLVQEGELYEYLANKLNIPILDRRKFKTKFFAEIFFCKNNHKSKNLKFFAKEFPEIYEIIKELKKNDYTFLSKLLQRVESNFVIHKIVKECMYRRMFITTIHDSVIVEENNINYVKNLIGEVFEPWGLNPPLRIK